MAAYQAGQGDRANVARALTHAQHTHLGICRPVWSDMVQVGGGSSPAVRVNIGVATSQSDFFQPQLCGRTAAPPFGALLGLGGVGHAAPHTTTWLDALFTSFSAVPKIIAFQLCTTFGYGRLWIGRLPSDSYLGPLIHTPLSYDPLDDDERGFYNINVSLSSFPGVVSASITMGMDTGTPYTTVSDEIYEDLITVLRIDTQFQAFWPNDSYDNNCKDGPVGYFDHLPPISLVIGNSSLTIPGNESYVYRSGVKWCFSFQPDYNNNPPRYLLGSAILGSLTVLIDLNRLTVGLAPAANCSTEAPELPSVSVSSSSSTAGTGRWHNLTIIAGILMWFFMFSLSTPSEAQ